MSHPRDHAEASARRYGGVWTDYIHIHDWFDQTKAHLPDARHRVILHNSFGIFLCEQMFGITFLRKSDGVEVRTRKIAEDHVFEDFGHIPNVEQCLRDLPIQRWMIQKALPLSKHTNAARNTGKSELIDRSVVDVETIDKR